MLNNVRTRAPKALALMSVAALLLAGCSSGATGAGGSSQLGVDAVPADKTTITAWSFLPGNYDDGAAAYNEVISAFEKKYPQITVKLVDMPYPTYFDQVRNATVSRKGPDVVTMYGGAQAYSYKNGLFPLQDAMDPEIKAKLKFQTENYSSDGNLYILPTGTYGYSMLVNQSKFSQAGVDPAAGLKDWASLLTTCRTLAAKGIQPIASGWKDGYLFETFMYMISSQMMDTATLKDWVAGKVPIDNPLFKTAAQHIVDMNNANCFGGKSALGRSMYDDAFNQYNANQAAMVPTGSLSTAAKAAGLVPSTIVMALPQVPESHFTSMIDAGAEAGWAVTKWTKSPQAARAFVNYLASPEAQNILWQKVGVPPNLANDVVEPKSDVQKTYLPLIENKENQSGFPAFPLPVLSSFEQNAAPLMGGTMTVDAFITQAQSAFAKSK